MTNAELEALIDIAKAAKAFADKMDECKPHIDGAFLFQYMHGGAYSGPTYGVALEALKAALSAKEEGE